MKEVDEAQAERLLALQIVPVAELVQVDALVHRGQHGGQQPAHKGQVILVNWLKSGNELSLIGINIGCVFLIDQFSRLLFYSQLDNPLKLLPPDFLPLDIQEVLNVLN